jgi:hypothetical protein
LPDERVRAILRTSGTKGGDSILLPSSVGRVSYSAGSQRPTLAVREARSFITSLAVDGRVAASTQNQALSARLFLYRDVLDVDPPWLACHGPAPSNSSPSHLRSSG